MGKACFELMNDAYRLAVAVRDRAVCVHLRDLAMGSDLADGPYVYRAFRATDEGSCVARWLEGVDIEMREEAIEISGSLAGLSLTHVLSLLKDRGIMEERMVLRNPTESVIELEDFEAGMRRRVSDEVGEIFPEFSSDRLVAVPFRHRATDPTEFDWDFRLADLMERPGREHRVNRAPLSWPKFGYLPAMRWASEGWAWIRGEHTLGIFKFSQDGMQLSVLSPEADEEGVAMGFGGTSMVAGAPSALREIHPGQTVDLGITRHQTVRGGHREACYAFRAFLDENGCRFPEGYDPPVHWNELYDNPEWNLGTPGNPEVRHSTRAVTYTRKLIEEEAEKARRYSCESIYLDPGWDTAFGTFLWGEEWLGPRREFIEAMSSRYGLKVSLHCPLATWMSKDARGVGSWPEESYQVDRHGNVVEGAVCLGSKQYRDEASERLLAHCADGVAFLMFDGNWWNGGCWNPQHGHPVPYTMEDHIRANVELARRIHEKHPQVLIEMHDMIAGGTRQRFTPVYYKYGLPGSYDENWGFELMWEPMEDILSGRARALYYYNLGCNVPAYLHVDLRDDNKHCLVLWWYASTCRHLGIGGTHPNPAVARAQRLAMKRYRELARFYKEGDFYGISEEIHLHVLPEENAFVVNLFNLSGASCVVAGTISFEALGCDPDTWYIMRKGTGIVAYPCTTASGDGAASGKGLLEVKRRLAPWATEVIEIRPLGALTKGMSG